MEGAAPHNKNVTVDKLLEGSFDEKDGKDYSNEEWYKKTDWWKAAMAKAEEESKKKEEEEGGAASDRPAPGFEPGVPTRSSDLVINKIMEFLEKQTRELESRIEAAEVFNWLEVSKAEEQDKMAEDIPGKMTGKETGVKLVGEEYCTGADQAE
jgi:hypothetical protein